MSRTKERSSFPGLKHIPGVGEKAACQLHGLGIHCLNDLKQANPEALYEKLCYQKKKFIDRCLLYQFRCAVYYASEKKPLPQLLKWWNWKD